MTKEYWVEIKDNEGAHLFRASNIKDITYIKEPKGDEMIKFGVSISRTEYAEFEAYCDNIEEAYTNLLNWLSTPDDQSKPAVFTISNDGTPVTVSKQEGENRL